MTVHNHGPSEGRGLDCPEVRVGGPFGALRGACLPEAATPIYDAMLLERAISDPEGVALVEGIHERLRAAADPYGVIAKREAIAARQAALLAQRPVLADAEVRVTQAVIRAAKGAALGLFR